MIGRRYPSDLTDGEWAYLAPLLPPPRPPGSRGRPRAVPTREVVNAILYVLRTGCQWRALPTDLPNWQTVYWYHRKWLDEGVWESVTDALRRQVRVRAGRDPNPSAAIIDSQSVKTTEKGAFAATMPARR
jgi:putative transposase